MSLTHKLDFGNATFGDLYRFVDHARAVGIPDDRPLSVETTDALGNPLETHALVADLGNIDAVSRPVLIDLGDARLYAEVVARLHLQEHSQESDRERIDHLLDDLHEMPHAKEQ